VLAEIELCARSSNWEMNDFEESLARLGDNESQKTRTILLDIEDKIFTLKTSDEQQSEEKNGDTDFDYYRGYDAISEHVDDKEILMWQKTFTYLRICGQGFELPSSEMENEIEEQTNEVMNERVTESLLQTSFGSDLNSLVICGSKIAISPSTQEEEVIFAHGTLEEVLEIDNTRLEQIVPDNIFLSIDPQYSHKTEVVNSLYDVLIPDLTDLISPLVQRLVRVCRDHGVSYIENPETTYRSSEDDCFSNDDDFGEFGPPEEEIGISEW
jgi:hypothetical protein